MNRQQEVKYLHGICSMWLLAASHINRRLMAFHKMKGCIFYLK